MLPRFVVSAEKEPGELSGLQPIELKENIKSLGIQKIGGAWWLVARGWYQDKNIAVFYRLRKSGNTPSLKHKARKGQKNMIICSQKYDFMKCTPVIGVELFCYCEGFPPPKGTCSTDGIGSVHGWIKSQLWSRSFVAAMNQDKLSTVVVFHGSGSFQGMQSISTLAMIASQM